MYAIDMGNILSCIVNEYWPETTE